MGFRLSRCMIDSSNEWMSSSNATQLCLNRGPEITRFAMSSFGSYNPTSPKPEPYAMDCCTSRSSWHPSYSPCYTTIRTTAILGED